VNSRREVATLPIPAKSISVVIPTYKPEESLSRVIDEVTASLGDYILEIIVVDDGTPLSNSNGVLDKIQKFSNMKIIRFSKNFGQQAAILAGYRMAAGDFVLTIDDDGQCPIREAQKLIDAMDGSTDVVSGVYSRKAHPLSKRLGSQIHELLLYSAFELNRGTKLSNFTLIRSYVAVSVAEFSGSLPYLPWLILSRTSRIKSIPVTHLTSLRSRSRYSFRMSFRLIIDFALTIAAVPARAFLIFGVFSSFVGLAAGLIITVQALTTGLLPGYGSLMAAILFYGGLQAFFAGVAFEYLGRLDRNATGKPQSISRPDFD
jgi:undecaprenyl-phosphate 4-deoxy-4-formamido-L-arabinose transferase